ncbi:glutamate transport system permease protein [Naumannella cuiyingiana]|uniref:Glutamate transport system permease protein n=1 Tax=Naumannella cuiyingiana TaxID=1347891 RepID=A0A7Z0DBZ8_9ACTN|nr:amino acid ABC transporter permease [Naumannella cuiyingiana]NYI72504.1 glutamate transport system permease protein [Naumannella cuiyingiana]
MSDVPVLFDVPGPRGRRLNVVLGVVAVALAAGAVGWVIWLMRAQLGPEMWQPFTEPSTWLYYVIPGLINTLQAALISVVLALLLGIALGMGRVSTVPAIRVVCGVFVEFFRSVPVLVLMVFFYTTFLFSGLVSGPMLPLLGVVCGLVLYNSTVIAELVRSGVGSLPRGQREAGLTVGLTEGQTLRAILLPQAITAMLPSLLNQLVVILKDTALGYIITYPELLRSLQTLASGRSNLIVSFLVGAAIVIVLNFGLTSLATAVQRRLSRRGRAPKQEAVAQEV